MMNLISSWLTVPVLNYLHLGYPCHIPGIWRHNFFQIGYPCYIPGIWQMCKRCERVWVSRWSWLCHIDNSRWFHVALSGPGRSRWVTALFKALAHRSTARLGPGWPRPAAPWPAASRRLGLGAWCQCYCYYDPPMSRWLILGPCRHGHAAAAALKRSLVAAAACLAAWGWDKIIMVMIMMTRITGIRGGESSGYHVTQWPCTYKETVRLTGTGSRVTAWKWEGIFTYIDIYVQYWVILATVP